MRYYEVRPLIHRKRKAVEFFYKFKFQIQEGKRKGGTIQVPAMPAFSGRVRGEDEPHVLRTGRVCPTAILRVERMICIERDGGRLALYSSAGSTANICIPRNEGGAEAGSSALYRLFSTGCVLDPARQGGAH